MPSTAAERTRASTLHATMGAAVGWYRNRCGWGRFRASLPSVGFPARRPQSLPPSPNPLPSSPSILSLCRPHSPPIAQSSSLVPFNPLPLSPHSPAAALHPLPLSPPPLPSPLHSSPSVVSLPPPLSRSSST